MSDVKTYPVPAEFAKHTLVNAEQYASMYQQSVEDPAKFWGEQAEKYLTWSKKWDNVLDWSFDESDIHIRWFEGGQLRVAEYC